MTEECNNQYLKLLAYKNHLKVCIIFNIAQAVI